MSFKPVDPKVDFPKQEEDVLKFWQEKDIFKKSVSQREGAEDFVFYDGPPFATGLPHFGHFIPSTIKDIIPRYQTMKGKHVERRFGWDCHGLPVENLIEKELGLNSKHEIEALGIDKFNDACRASVLKYTSEWRTTITRMGRWVDFDNDYKTMNPEFMESIWWVAKTLWDKGLIYEGKYILPYCPRCSTVLSTHELAQGYKDVQDQTVTVRFKITKAPEGVNDPDMANGKTYFLAWTTTPWTLPSNLGLCMGPEIDYVKILDKESGDYYIFAEARLSAYYKNEDAYEIIYRHKGKEFLGAEYEPLFPYFAQLKDPAKCEEMSGQKCEKGAFRMFNAEYVSTEDGTGIVHIAPAFGEEDNKVFRGSGVPNVEPIDAECKFTKEVSDYQGIFVKDADKDIMKRLKEEGKLVKRDSIVHSYPHCWRCGSPLIYRGIGSWFVKVADYHDVLLKANSKINWQPAHIKEGRFGKWLAGARDWAVSRNRYWGNPIPIWRCDDPDCKHTLCVGSRQELKELSGVYPEDLHKQFVDKITFKCPKCGKGTMKRIPEVFDCWFESGSMPYAQVHYPFENRDLIDKGTAFPADFIAEGVDQTRGWFFTLHAIATMAFDSVAFKTVISNGLVLDKNGIKMSKRLGNVINPFECIGTFGADAVRWYMITNSSPWDNLSFDPEGVKEVTSSFFIKLQQAYAFFTMYANVDGFEYKEADIPYAERPDFDRWMLSELNDLVKNVQTYLDDFDPTPAGRLIQRFVIDFLSNWYIRLNKPRFWAGEMTADKLSAYQTLYICLDTLSRLIAPIAPFYADQLFRDLNSATGKDNSSSVHLAKFPTFDEAQIDSELNEAMQAAMDVTSMGLSIRKKVKIPVIQALQAIAIPDTDPVFSGRIERMKDIITKEVNVKELQLMDGAKLVKSVKCNFRVMGKKFGKMMKAVADAVTGMSQAQIAELESKGQVILSAAGEDALIELADVDIMSQDIPGWSVANEGTVTVALDITVTPELKVEGNARKIIKQIQNIRKSSGFEITDRITVQISDTPEVQDVLARFKANIAAQVLANSIEIADNNGEEIKFEDFSVKIKVQKN